MSFFNRLLYRNIKESLLPARFSKDLLERNTSFKFGMAEISTKMNIGEWYITNYIVTTGRNFDIGSDIEHLQREFNNHSARKQVRNLMIFTAAIYLYELLIFEKPFYDWQDSHDPKFDQRLYGDLEEGGDEGGDDD